MVIRGADNAEKHLLPARRIEDYIKKVEKTEQYIHGLERGFCLDVSAVYVRWLERKKTYIMIFYNDQPCTSIGEPDFPVVVLLLPL